MDKGIKKVHGDFYETASNEQSCKMQKKGKGKMATEETFFINPLKGTYRKMAQKHKATYK